MSTPKLRPRLPSPVDAAMPRGLAMPSQRAAWAAWLGLAVCWPLGSAAQTQAPEPILSPERNVAGPAPGSAAEAAEEADWPARVGRIAEVQGQVRLLDRDDNEWVPATVNRPVTSGDHLVSEPGARLELSIGSTTLRLGADSELLLERIDDGAVRLQLRRGSLALQVTSTETAAQIEVVTPEGRFRPREIGSFRIDRVDDATHATAWRGTLRFEGRDSELVVGRGQHAEIWLEGAARSTHYRWADDTRDEFAQWVARDEVDFERSPSARYVSPEMTGWQDLDRHGQWDAHPEYGGVWIPAAVPTGWAPYRSGHWTWIAPWGWTWVDSARWGFAPFHYGRWVHWNRRWCWVPGQRAARPVFSPALVAWIGGPRVGVTIGGPVGWVALGPRDVYHRHFRNDRRDRDDRDGRRGRGNDRDGDRGDDRRGDRDGDRRGDRDGDRDGRSGGRGGSMRYTNQGVPGAVTTASHDAFALRRVVTVTPNTPAAITHSTMQPLAVIAPPPAPPRAGRSNPHAGDRPMPAWQQRERNVAEREPIDTTPGVRPPSTRERGRFDAGHAPEPRVLVPPLPRVRADVGDEQERGRGRQQDGHSAGRQTGGPSGPPSRESVRPPFSARAPVPAPAPAVVPAPAPMLRAPEPAVAPRAPAPAPAPARAAEPPRGQPPGRDDDRGRPRGAGREQNR
jgi:hypothetical protein